jgi:hypothetical protein
MKLTAQPSLASAARRHATLARPARPARGPAPRVRAAAEPAAPPAAGAAANGNGLPLNAGATALSFTPVAAAPPVVIPEPIPGVVPPAVVYARVVDGGAAKAALPWQKILVLGALAGVYVGFGGLLMHVVAGNCPGEPRGAARRPAGRSGGGRGARGRRAPGAPGGRAARVARRRQISARSAPAASRRAESLPCSRSLRGRRAARRRFAPPACTQLPLCPGHLPQPLRARPRPPSPPPAAPRPCRLQPRPAQVGARRLRPARQPDPHPHLRRRAVYGQHRLCDRRDDRGAL